MSENFFNKKMFSGISKEKIWQVEFSNFVL